MPERHESFSDQLRQAIRDSGQSQLSIGRATGVQQAVLSKFLSGRRGLSIESIERLVEHLGLELHPRTLAAKGE
jgi:transcriptional regulator with XRE-family HTH domain